MDSVYDPVLISLDLVRLPQPAIGQVQVLVSSAMSSFDSFSTASATYPVLQDCAIDLCESKNDMTSLLDMVSNVMYHEDIYTSHSLLPCLTALPCLTIKTLLFLAHTKSLK